MDLHLVGPAATAEERAAVDALLDPRIGPARGGWDGGARDAAIDGRLVRGGHEARSHRDLLLPVLHAIQDRIGWISHGALLHACRRLTVPPADAYGVATFYGLLATEPRPPRVAHVCDALACRLAGAERICADLELALGPAGGPPDGAQATWLRSPCLGQCERAPVALLTLAAEAPARIATGPVDAATILAHLADPGTPDRSPLAAGRDTRPSPDRLAAIRGFVPQATQDGLRLLARVGRVDPTSLEDYLASGGYLALREALAMGPARVVEELGRAGVLGRGGAAFPSGRKWEAVAAAPAPRYVVCNADEAEPGTFKDRAIVEEDPFSLVESMTIAGLAIGAARGYLYIRGEYPLGEARMAGAIRAARAAGYLGERILGSELAFEIEIRRGAGAYIGGEETALFESIEGDRAEPRMKPPFPAEVGLFGRPTAVNNVETLVNVPWIVLEGGETFATIGSGGSTGTKLFSLSGHIARPGVYEVPFGATLGELIAVAGGVPGGRAIKAVLLGGAAGVFVGPESLDLPLTYEAARAARVTLGSGAVVVFDETADIAAVLLRIAAFFRDESCGQCVPCRVGTVRQEELLARLAARRPRGTVEDELALLADLGQVLRDASICGLGQTANEAVRTGLRFAGMAEASA
jgi:NADH-quinone oxidoreductase subunit F